MQIVSQAVKALLDSYAKVSLTVHIDGEEVDAGLGAFEYSPACGSDEEFSFGNACAAGITLTLAASMPNLKGKRITVEWSVDAEKYPLFTGRVETATVSAGQTSVEAWDDMFYGGSELFQVPADLLTDCDAADAFLAVAAQIGVEAEQASANLLSGITIPDGLTDLPEESSCSEVAGHIAGLVGGNAMMDRSGLLVVRQYAQTDWQTEPYSGEASAVGNGFAVSGVTMQRPKTITTKNEDGTESEEDIVLEFGAGDGTLMVENPLASQEAADLAYANLDGLEIRPGSYGFPGGIVLEPGDIFTVKSMDGSYRVAAAVITMSIDGGVRTAVSCGGSNVSCGSVGKINQMLQTLMADYARIKQLVADNATIGSAFITNLTANVIKSGSLKSSDGKSFVLDLDNNTISADSLSFTVSGKTADKINAEVSNNAGNISKLSIRVDEISLRVTDAEGNASEAKQTAQEVSSEVLSLYGSVSALSQTVNGFDARVKDAEGNASSAKQTAAEASTEVSNLQGDVTTLKQTAGQVSVEVKDGNVRLSTYINADAWSALRTENGEVTSGFYYDFELGRFIYKGAGEFYSKDGSTFITIEGNRLVLHSAKTGSRDAVEKLSIGFITGRDPDDTMDVDYPYILLGNNGSDDGHVGLIKKFWDGMFVGNSKPKDAAGKFTARPGYAGFFIDTTKGASYVVQDDAMKNVYTGDAIARFG